MKLSDSGNLGDIFSEHSASARVAVIDLYDPKDPKEYTFQEFNAACDAAANGLLIAGIEPGDRIGILALNRVE